MGLVVYGPKDSIKLDIVSTIVGVRFRESLAEEGYKMIVLAKDYANANTRSITV